MNLETQRRLSCENIDGYHAFAVKASRDVILSSRNGYWNTGKTAKLCLAEFRTPIAEVYDRRTKQAAR